jgi:transposase
VAGELQRAKATIRKQRGRIRELEAARDSLERERDGLQGQLESARKEIRSLQEALAKAKRARKRQAAPFSKGDPKPNPKKPGRKSGREYGERAFRSRPEQIDEVCEAPLPEQCPHCGCAEIEELGVEPQYVTDIPPVQPHTTQFNVHKGRCSKCKKLVQGRHSRQHSDALGAASIQVGPNVIVLSALLNKDVGASYRKISRFVDRMWSLRVAPSTLVRGMERLADRATAAYERILEQVKNSEVVYPDETGWKVGGERWWLWAIVAAEASAYLIAPSRGYAVPAGVLGEDYDGTMGHDGWHSYDQFKEADHQTCNAHLLRRCDEILQSATRGAVRFPRAVKAILKKGLELRDRREAGEISPHGLRSVLGRMEKALDRELARNFTYEPNRKFAAHLLRHRDEIFTYLRNPGVEATNWPAEQAIRPAVVNRKMSGGGNRTEVGAHTQEVLTSVLRTCAQRAIEPHQFLVELLTSEDPTEYAKRALGP